MKLTYPVGVLVLLEEFIKRLKRRKLFDQFGHETFKNRITYKCQRIKNNW